MSNISQSSIKPIDLHIDQKLHNRFDVEVINASTGEVKQRAVGYNVILNQFWTRAFNNQTTWSHIQYGTGTGTPASTDTALFSYLGGLAASAAIYDDSHYVEGWNSFTKYITLDEQTAVGATLSEVGLAGAASGSLCTHALLCDMNGNPITITKTNTDIIKIYATVYIHWNISGNNGVKFIPSMQWFGKYQSSGNLVGGKALSNTGYTFVSSSKNPVADVSNKTWTWGPWRINSDSGNIGGISHILLANGAFDVDISGAYQITGESVGTGDGTQTEFSLSFDAPYDITVYVDGVEQTSGVTTNLSLTQVNTFNVYLDCLDMQSTTSVFIPKKFTKGWNLMYFKYYQTHAIESIACYNTSTPYDVPVPIYCSNDLITWEEARPSGGSNIFSVPVEYQHYKFWKVEASNSLNFSMSTSAVPSIVFNTPPAAGAVITADYKTPFLPKDIDHVYDFSVTVSLGEYSEP